MLTKNYLATYAKSFNWAGFFLPKNTYEKCSALYDFCREADNIADDPGKLEDKIIKFENFKKDFLNKNFQNIVIKNIWELIDEFNISTKAIDDLFDGINSDINERVELKSKKELLIYSYRVAGTVGLMMAKILKVNKINSLKSAIDLGIAMQLTNISRDVIEDKNNKRSYINENFNDIKYTISLSEKYLDESGVKLSPDIWTCLSGVYTGSLDADDKFIWKEEGEEAKLTAYWKKKKQDNDTAQINNKTQKINAKNENVKNTM